MGKSMRECSGAIVLRKKKGRIQVLLVRSNSAGNWVFPKGGVEKGLDPEENAVKEVAEEAGVVCSVMYTTYPYSYKCSKEGRPQRIVLFVARMLLNMEVYDEMGTRERGWFTINQAKKRLPEPQGAALDHYNQVIDEIAAKGN